MIRFCDNCLKDVKCTYNEKEKEIEVDNIKVKYLKKYYVCSECNKEFLDDLADYDTQAVNNELRKHYDIITTDEINEILNKYSIGKKPLSIVLGLGEVNILRYLNGSNPTKEISNLLKMVLNNPFLYELYLINSKDNISEVAYEKSLGKTKQIELSKENSKLYRSALYMIKELDETDALSIQKNLFFANGFSSFFLGSKLFNDNPEAWIHGPVYKEIYDCFSYYKSNTIDYGELFKNIEVDLTEEEKNYLNEIILSFGIYSGSQLREMTHLTTPWLNARKGLKDEDYSSRIIDSNEMNKYFKDIYEKYNMKELKDIEKYSNDLSKLAKKNKAKKYNMEEIKGISIMK